jgi:uncharacterized protein (TIGR02266 family)
VAFPVKVCFEGEAFQIREFTANLSVGGIFLPTDRPVPPRTQGTLTFKISQWEEPFTVKAEVVRTAPPGGGPDEHPGGLGIMFIDLTRKDKARLQRLVDGIRDGSIAQSIRRSIRESSGLLLQELRKRPADHKVIFAIAARGVEIEALIRDGNPTAVLRLLDNPRLSLANLRQILRDPRSSVKILDEIKGNQRWMADEEVRALFCTHPNAGLQDALKLLPRLPVNRLSAMGRNASLRPPIRLTAKSLSEHRSGRLRS